MATIAYLVGARPNFVKVAPVLHALRETLPNDRHLLIHTGQHYDREMSDLFFEALDIPPPDYLLGVGSGSHGAQTGRALELIEEVLVAERPDVLIVPGDVNSTLAGALAAAKLDIPVAHLEAGLRSYDESMPEEINRVLVDRLSRWCFTHSPEAEGNLVREGVDPHRIHFVGNTMIDALVHVRPAVLESTVHERLGIAPREYILATLHRPKLVDGPLFPDAIAALAALAGTHPVVLPVHPRIRGRLAALPAAEVLILTDPVGYVDFLALEGSAAAVVTDSGGVQEETTFLGIPCFTLRDNTERPVTVEQGTNTLLGLDPAALASIPELLRRPRRLHSTIPGWDGIAAGRVARIVADALAPSAVLTAAR
jgi:UDP-N-acetylglucosamine 2-epimerase (non-hydrolysing)